MSLQTDLPFRPNGEAVSFNSSSPVGPFTVQKMNIFSFSPVFQSMSFQTDLPLGQTVKQQALILPSPVGSFTVQKMNISSLFPVFQGSTSKATTDPPPTTTNSTLAINYIKRNHFIRDETTRRQLPLL